jgi:hypothetical protein
MRNATMAKQSNRTTFTLANWEASIATAVKGAETSGVAMTRLVREAAPHNLDKDKAREVFQLAYGAVFADLNKCTIEEAVVSKTVRNRVSDCLCVLFAPAVVGEGDKALRVDALMGSIQTVAAKVRAASPKKERAPRQPKAPKEVATGEGESSATTAPLSGLQMLENALNVLKAQLGDNATCLELIGELTDLAGDLADALSEADDRLLSELEAA